MLVGAARGIAFVLRASLEHVVNPDPFDDQHPALDLDLTLYLRGQMTLAGFDLARFQRATQGSGQSTGGRGDDVVEGSGVRVERARRRMVMLGHLVMHPEEHRLASRRKIRPPQRTLHPLDPNPGGVGHWHDPNRDTTGPRPAGAKLR
jgi:hypothetical protein